MNEQLFRKKSIERVSSPEQLNDYIRVSNPSVWMILAAIIILLVGVCAWGVLGHLDTTLSVVAVADGGQMTCYVKEADIASVETGMTVVVNETEYEIAEIAAEPMAVNADFSDYVLHIGNLQTGEWVYPVTVAGTFADGNYSAKIVIDSVSPMSFVLN